MEGLVCGAETHQLLPAVADDDAREQGVVLHRAQGDDEGVHAVVLWARG